MSVAGTVADFTCTSSRKAFREQICEWEQPHRTPLVRPRIVSISRTTCFDSAPCGGAADGLGANTAVAIPNQAGMITAQS